ncbi:MAG: methyl-accepting chemotaxis protein [Spirochaetota bacterium]
MTKRGTIIATAGTILFSLAAAALAVSGAGDLLVGSLAGLTALAGVTSTVLAMVERRDAHRALEECGDAARTTQTERDTAWEQNVLALEREIAALKEAEGSRDETKVALAEAIGLIRETAPIITGLANKAIEKSEHGSTTLTEDIYELGRQSTRLSESITGFLTEMSTGDESLTQNIEELNRGVGRLADIAELCDEANTSLDRSITRVSQSVGHTSELIGQVSDIAEQTGILAINAAIYAAKAGEFGQGFSVIASEIQKLAATSKEVAQTIGTNTITIERQVSDFSKTHKALMQESQSSLAETIGSIEKTIAVLRPKAERISGSIQSAASVSATVTSRLDEINVAMQEQDAIQQIVGHIAQILEEAVERAPHLDDAFRVDAELIRERARTLAIRHFTMEDEFVAVGHDGYEVSDRERAVLEDGTELAGDVTLF